MINVLIADDHPIVRKGIKQLVNDAFSPAEVDEVGTSQDVLDMVSRKSFDVVLLDLRLPGIGGLEVLKTLRKGWPGLPVLVITIHSEEQYAIQAFRAGASGYLTKESAPDQLIAAITVLTKGKKYITPSLAERLASFAEVGGAKIPHLGLSNREYQVMCAIASGQTLTDIARELSLSVKTIGTYRHRLMIKMNMSKNSELVRYAIDNHLIS